MTSRRWPTTAASSTAAARSASRASSRSATGTRRTPASAAARSTSGIRASRARTTRTRPRSAKVADLSVFGAKGSAHRVRPGLQVRARHGRHGARPGVHQGPPVHVRPVLPVLGRRAGQGHRPEARPGLRPAARYKGEQRLSRFTYDETTKTFVPGSEKVIFRYMTQVYNCCHNGAGMDLDSKGNLYFTTGDNARTATAAGQEPSNNNTAATPTRTRSTRIPCPGHGADDALRRRTPTRTVPAATGHTPCAAALAITDRPDRRPGSLAAAATRATATRARPRATRTPTRARSSGSSRWPNPGDHARASARRTRSRAPTPRTARTCSRPTARPVLRRQGQAGDLRDGRAQHLHDPHRQEDRHDHRRVGRPRPGHQEPDVGPGQDRERRR